ncbi:MAG: SRPBCC domain-containing protein [Flavobacterium sp.]
MKEFIVNKRIDIRAETKEVWDALTNPEKTKKYFFNSKVYSDWETGSTITFKGKMFLIISFEMSGEILEIDPQKLLKYNLKNSKSSSMSVVTDKLTYENGITTLTISDNVGFGEGAEKRYKKSNQGWDKILKGLKELVEKENSNNH